ncbi:MAG TPA: hypothetical protein VGM68_10940 [Rhizomicrobium sp.]|jgi:hypothetical protein
MDDTLAVIDRLLLAPIRVRLGGKTKIIPSVGAIVLQLLQKEMAGDSQAGRVLLQYEKLDKQKSEERLEIEFVDSDYTRTFGDFHQEDGNA